MNTTASRMQGQLVLGRYRVIKQLARGGMGVVYLARTEGAQGFTRPVIVKRVISDLAEDEASARAFAREARILSNLQHPGIVNVIDFNEEQGAYVMVLEYVHGYNLGQWHKYVLETRKQMPVEYAIYIVTRVLDALQYAHAFVRADGTPMQIIHRDVSPGNILIDTQGQVKLVDFGIARAEEADEYKTRDGLFKGKLSYSAPEVYEGTTSPKSDMYSTAVVLYQLLAGENPFRGKDMAEIVRKVLSFDPPPIREKRPDVSPALDAAIARALAKNPQDRYPSAAAFADALRSVRERREEDFVTEFADDVWNDFNGDMPAKLGIEPLQTRDAAWRAATPEDGDSRNLLISSAAPAPRDSKATVVAVPIPRRDTEETVAAPTPARKLSPWVAASGLAVVAGAVAVYALTSRPREQSRFVVVERQSTSEASSEPSATALAPSATAAAAASVPEAPPSASEAPSAPPVGTATPHAKPSDVGGKPDAVMLSRKVQSHRGAIEGCFATHVKEVEGRPEVAVRFRVGAAGRVEGADLVPAALAGTPLGQCLLQVARAIDFGPQSEPVSFTIPITARRVK